MVIASAHRDLNKPSDPKKHGDPNRPSDLDKHGDPNRPSDLDKHGDPSKHGAVETRRAELGRFLKASRSRISPDEVGLPPGPRRRTPGLRREEVALLAGVGVTWYTWLEQGRPINASTQVLDAVAQTLQLDQAGRWHLYRLAEATPVRSFTVSDVVPESVLEVLHSLDPVPATLINSRFDIIASNSASEDFFWDWHSLPCIHRNTLWCCVTEPQARGQFVNYDDEVAYMVARMRAAYALHVGEPEWEENTSEELQTLILRYLAAFGPASVQDMQTWSGLSGLKSVVEALKPQLCSYQDEQGNVLFDLQDLQLPPDDISAPPRFLPEFDNLILSHANRQRVIVDAYRSSIFLSAGRVRATFLIDGFVSGTWKTTREKGVATLIIEPFAPLSDQHKDELIEEGERLIRFIEDKAEKFIIQVQ